VEFKFLRFQVTTRRVGRAQKFQITHELVPDLSAAGCSTLAVQQQSQLCRRRYVDVSAARRGRHLTKLAFHDADTDTDILADILSRMSSCRSVCHGNNLTSRNRACRTCRRGFSRGCPCRCRGIPALVNFSFVGTTLMFRLRSPPSKVTEAALNDQNVT